MLHVCGNQHCGLSNADVALGQQLFIAANLRQPGLKSCPLAGYKKKVMCAINVFRALWSKSLA